VKKTSDDYPPLSLRRRVLIGLLAVVTAVTIVLLLVYRPGDPKHEALRAKRETAAQAAALAASSAASVVGGKADVILVTPAGR
jgi:uncharacterized PurR-regulated membrane protein YhhQ (DUF165 family)